jgi:uncharacterized circularly permuted ATP-grasp superfamily protein
MTTKIAIRIVEKIILENRENGELEGVLNRHRVAALNHLLSFVYHKSKVIRRGKARAKI